MNRFWLSLVSLYVFAAAFVACVLTSTVFYWHEALTRPAMACCAVAFIACGLWLNRAAGRRP